MSSRMFGLATLACVVLSGCVGPAPKDHYVSCETNDTMIILSLPSEQKQAKLDSQKALEEGQISAKRYKLPMSKHGYGWHASEFQYVSDVMAVIVDRAVVSVELTKDPFTGTSQKDEALEVSSENGIKFSVGAVLSARIEETDAARYVFHYGVVPEEGKGSILVSDDSQLTQLQGFSEAEKLLYQSGLIDKDKRRVDYVTYTFRARPLSEVLNNDVLGFCQAKLSERFNAATLDTGKTKKMEYFQEVFQEAVAFFKARGVTLTVFGNTEGMTYKNKLVQDAIDARFGAINSVRTALQDELALEETNKRQIDQSRADRDAAIQFLASYPAMRQGFEIELRKLQAERQEILRYGWDGAQPMNILPSAGQAGSGTQLLLQVGK